VQNPSQFFGDIGKTEVKNIVNQVGYDPIKQPFGQSYALNLINQYKQTSQMDMQSSLSKVINDPTLLKNYQNNFNTGGWNAFLVNTQYQQNNYIGYTMLANGQVASKLSANGNTTSPNLLQKATTTLSQGGGFLSPTTCPTNSSYNTMANEFNPPVFKPNYSALPNIPDCLTGFTDSTCTNQADIDKALLSYNTAYNEQQTVFNQDNTCLDANGKSALVATTPGAVVSNQIMSSLNLKTGVAGLDAALGNSLSAILNAFMNHFLQEGLSGLSQAVKSIPSPDNWTYNGQSLSITTTIPNQLIVPTSVTVKPGNTSPTTISGGKAPYSIQTPPSSSVATANISGITLSVAGVAGGQTSFVIQDSSSPIQTATIQVTTSLIIDFNNPSALQSISVPVGASTNINISNGTAPYSIQTEPDSSIALGLISDNTLIIVGSTAGNSSITLQDSSTPAKVITLKIAIGTETQLTASPASISTTSDATNGTATTTVTISGGTPPYTISKQPDSSIVGSVLITGSTLNVTTATVGNTSVTIQDSFSPTPNTLIIPITANKPLPADINFDAPATQNVSISTTSSKSLTMSGGSGIGTYNLKSQSNPSVDSVSVSTNTVTITGLTAGSDTVVIQDSSFSPSYTSSSTTIPAVQNKTVTINITVSNSSTTSSTGTTTTTSSVMGTCIYGSQTILSLSQSACTTIGGTKWTAN
jgi:hypothetical protein